MTGKEEYLKKYLSLSKEKKKKKMKSELRLKIVESDAFLPVYRQISDSEDEDDLEIRTLYEEIQQKAKKGGIKGGFKNTFVAVEDLVKSETKIEQNQSASEANQPSQTLKAESISAEKSMTSRKNSDDLSPPRRRLISKRHDSDSDISPPRKRRNDSEDLSPPRRNRRSPDHRRHSPESTKTLDGKKAGLQSAKDMKEEAKKLKEKEEKMFHQMSTAISGRFAEANVRASQRRGKENKEDSEKKKREAEKQIELEEKYKQWNKGVLQLRNREEQLEEMRRVVEGPMTRTAEDVDMNKYLKERILEDDPMAAMIKKRNREEAIDRGDLVYPVYEKSFPPNRYAIRPGYRWDGVDRSNGFENKLMIANNRREAIGRDVYRFQNLEA